MGFKERSLQPKMSLFMLRLYRSQNIISIVDGCHG